MTLEADTVISASKGSMISFTEPFATGVAVPSGLNLAAEYLIAYSTFAPTALHDAVFVRSLFFDHRVSPVKEPNEKPSMATPFLGGKSIEYTYTPSVIVPSEGA
jgi:hypothetical protein